MVHGCQKRIYYIKNVGGELFEEAYFIMRNDAERTGEKRVSRDNLAREADRIISESEIGGEWRAVIDSIRIERKKDAGRKRFAGRAAAFLLGAISSSAVISAVALFLKLV